MRKVIRLKSRYGEIHKLVRIGEKNSHLFLFIPADTCYRVGFSDNEMKVIEFVDPSGGPFIYVGMKFDNPNKTVKSIRYNENNKIIIEFE